MCSDRETQEIGAGDPHDFRDPFLFVSVTAPPLCVGFEPDTIALLFLTSSSYCGNRMLSAQLHGKQLASAP